MRLFCLVLLGMFFNSHVQGQLLAADSKLILTLESMRGRWSTASDGALSNNGDFVCYSINQKGGSRFFVESTRNDWKVEFKGISTPAFTADSKFMIFQFGVDSLCLLDLAKKKALYLPGVTTYKLQPGDAAEWLAYRPSGGKELVLRQLKTGKEQQYDDVSNFLFSPNVKTLFLEIKNTDTVTALQRVEIASNQKTGIWSDKGSSPVSYVFDGTGDKLAFLTEAKKEQISDYTIWYYQDKWPNATSLVDQSSPGLEKDGKIVNAGLQFSRDGQSVLFTVQPPPLPKPDPSAVKVDVWSYQDKELQSLQLASLKYPDTYICAAGVQDKKIIRLEQPNEKIVGHSDGYVLVKYGLGNNGLFESNWNTAAQEAFYLVSTRDGSRKLLKDQVVNLAESFGTSATGKYLINYSIDKKDFFCYEVATGQIRNITQGANISWLDEDDDRPDPQIAWFPGPYTWLANDEAVLVYDTYDVWLVDPSGNKKPVNLTNGYGRAHKIKLRLANVGEAINSLALKKEPDILLKAVDMENNDWGFFTKKIGSTGDPEKLIMGSYVYGTWSGHGTYNEPPLKAKKTNTYLLLRMSATEAPNYMLTHDFKTFKSLTNVQPQKAFNWLTTELVHWRLPDGSVSAGILYKPENFDSTKKYPVIFDYYERRSDELNLFIVPHASDNRINIPLFVSSGYLVFVPDIHYRIGAPGESAYDAVVSAAEYLAKMPFVDADRMGLQGHSWGGYQTNYIVTHSNLFAAACSASGFCDLISWYGADARAGYPKYHAERDQGRMGGTPWQLKEQYIKNSPIYEADKVNTPLLMMNNKGDNVVYFSQGVEFFTALRRLGKTVWMLQYDGGFHSVNFGNDAVDFHTRMMQFFDHYLKDKPASIWMTKGIPAKLKGIENGLEIDQTFTTPTVRIINN